MGFYTKLYESQGEIVHYRLKTFNMGHIYFFEIIVYLLEAMALYLYDTYIVHPAVIRRE